MKIHEELLVVVKNSSAVIDAKALIVNSSLIWIGLAIDTETLKVASIKVPKDKTSFWLQRLKESDVFSTIKINKEGALKSIKHIAENTFVNLRKGYSYGNCPVYDVTFFKDRKVIFEGIDNILIKGKQEFVISKKQQEKLIHLFNKTSLKGRSSFIDKSLADFPSTVITHQNKQIEIKLWKDVPKELVLAHRYLEGILLEKKLIE